MDVHTKLRIQRADRQLRYLASLKGRAYRLHRSCFQGAKRRGLDFSMSVESVFKKLSVGKCAVTGLPFDYSTGRDNRRGLNRTKPFAPSVDRIDATKGYSDDNTRVVLFAVNFALGDWGDEVTLQIAKALVRGLSKRLQ